MIKCSVKLTPEIVAKYYRLAEERWKIHVHRSPPLALDLAHGVPIIDELLSDEPGKWAYTIGDHVYVPFVPGVAIEGWSLRAQTIVLAHEYQHVVQSRYIGGLLSSMLAAISYLIPRKRLQMEVDAYTCSMAVRHHLTGTTGVKAYIDTLKKYYVNKNSAKEMILAASATVSRGVYPTCAKEAIGLLHEAAGGQPD